MILWNISRGSNMCPVAKYNYYPNIFDTTSKSTSNTKTTKITKSKKTSITIGTTRIMG